MENLMPCEVCGADVVVDKVRSGYLCVKHRNIVTDELCTPFVPESKGDKIRVYYPNTNDGNALIA